MSDKQIPELAQDWLEHVSVCTSQYDSTCRSLACELLRSRSKVKELECLRACDTLIIDWAQPRIAELRGQRNIATAKVRELEQALQDFVYITEGHGAVKKQAIAVLGGQSARESAGFIKQKDRALHVTDKAAKNG